MRDWKNLVIVGLMLVLAVIACANFSGINMNRVIDAGNVLFTGKTSPSAPTRPLSASNEATEEAAQAAPTQEAEVVPSTSGNEQSTSIPATEVAEQIEGTIVPLGNWTEPLLDNMMLENAIQIRPNKPFENGESLAPIGEMIVYQLKSTFIDTDLSTWKPGELVEFDLAYGWRPILIGVQGDAYTSLCWQAENDKGTQVLMKLSQSNGGSALVHFVRTDEHPDQGIMCP